MLQYTDRRGQYLFVLSCPPSVQSIEWREKGEERCDNGNGNNNSTGMIERREEEG